MKAHAGALDGAADHLTIPTSGDPSSSSSPPSLPLGSPPPPPVRSPRRRSGFASPAKATTPMALEAGWGCWPQRLAWQWAINVLGGRIDSSVGAIDSLGGVRLANDGDGN
ncbi:hypothetical protein TIFTF001_047672 [Ficus carica]|uniref:Uncharacterized protein n=1 Tax=Ficus carica TaxID=3494 RepID=A0AA87YWT4_FICCA|nr:hypothetical protein TIFTF001_047672 [Ficus carica]